MTIFMGALDLQTQADSSESVLIVFLLLRILGNRFTFIVTWLLNLTPFYKIIYLKQKFHFVIKKKSYNTHRCWREWKVGPFLWGTTTIGKHGELPQNIWCDSVTQKWEISGMEKQLQTSLKHNHNNQGMEHPLIMTGWRNYNTHTDIHKSDPFWTINSRSRFLKYIFIVFVMTIFKIFC